MHMNGLKPSTRRAKSPHAPTHLSLGEDLVLVILSIELHRLHQLRFRKLLGVLRTHRPRSHNADVPIDQPLVAHQPGGLVGRQARVGIESACITIDVVIPLIGASVVVELADFDSSPPSQMLLQLALFRALVAKIGKVEWLNLVGDVVEDGRVGGSRRSAEDVAVGFWGAGLAGCFAGRFVGAPVASLAVLAAVFGILAGAAFASAGFRTRGIEADVGHDGIQDVAEVKGVVTPARSEELEAVCPIETLTICYR